jgi:hypothetical protein
MSLVAASIKRTGHKVLFINHETHLGLELQSWQAADEFALALKRVIRHGGAIQTSNNTRIRQEAEDTVLIEVRGNTFIQLPNAVAQELCNSIIGNARLIEQDESAADLAFDQALLIRSGALPGIGLTDNKDIQELAAQEAAHNTMLRRVLPGSIKQQIQYGTPSVKRG